MERGHMPGYLFSDGFDEFSYFFQLLVGIIQAGNNKRRYLDPDVCLFIKPDRVENRLKLCAADLFVKIFGKSLEVYVRCMEIWPDNLKRLGCDVPVRHEHILQSRIDCQARRIIGEFKKDRGLGIGIGQAARKEMKERLFLYGVDVLRDDLVVDERVEHAALVLAHGADAAPSVCD